MTVPFRRRVETSLGPLVVVLSRLPRAVPFLVVLALLLTGLAAGGVVGTVLLLVLAALMAVLLFLGWPRLTPQDRLLRGVVLALVVVRALTF